MFAVCEAKGGLQLTIAELETIHEWKRGEAVGFELAGEKGTTRFH